jgi:hypothetical protein
MGERRSWLTRLRPVASQLAAYSPVELRGVGGADALCGGDPRPIE